MNLEAVGSAKESIWHESAKYDWLMGRPDVQENPEHASFVHKLQAMHPEHDQLFPWLLREYKKGRINDVYSDQIATDPESTGAGALLHYKDHDGRMKNLEADHLDQIGDWMKYMKQAKKGVDIMKHEIGPAVKDAQKNDEGGETVHNFTGDDDSNPYGHYDDWTIKRLRNRRDMRKEGQRMDHCVGSNGMGYLEKNDEGKGAYYSLRTPNNEPVATLEMTPKGEHYYMCPGCGKPAFGEQDYNAIDAEGKRMRQVNCEHCATPLAKSSPEDIYKMEPLEGVQQFPTKINHKRPTADHMEAAQLFGASDKRLEDEHEGLVNGWLGKHGHSYKESDGDEDYENEDEDEYYEPWWDSEYFVDGADNMDDFINRHVHGDIHEDAPDEYHRAMRDADEHSHHDGVHEPDLALGEPDVDSVFQDMTEQMSGGGTQSRGNSSVDPHKIADMFKHMDDAGYGDEWRDLAQTWLNDEYNAYLDPYGQQKGIGFFPNDQQKRRTIGPPATGDEYGDNSHGVAEPANGPGTQYPTSWEGDELFAKNLDYHLNKFRDPQEQHREDRGEADTLQSPYELRRRYPWLRPGDQQEAPNIPLKENVPIPDQRGVTIEEPGARQELEGERPGIRRNQSPEHLPYGRGIEFEPAGSGGRRNVHPDQPVIPGSAYDQKRDVDAFRPKMPTSPEEAFGQEDARFHQRPIPGMPGAFDPMQLEQYSEMQQQGQLMPQHWYRKNNGSVHRAKLPPELYPPGSLMYENTAHQQVYAPGGEPTEPEQTVPMWQRSQGVPSQSLVQTQNEIGSEGWGSLGDGARPSGPWVAKTAGPWTDHEAEQWTKDWSGPHEGVPHLNGRVVETSVPQYQELPMMEWRRPVVYHRDEDKLYVGQPSMEHGDMMQQMGKESPWDRGMPRRNMMPGYIDLTSHLGEGGLHFFQGGMIPKEDQFHDWVEGRFGVRRPENPLELNEADWTSSYHPRQDDEWVAGDEADFSVVEPEARWTT